MILGAHMGVSKGLDQAVRELKAIGGDALQIFSKSPQMFSGPPIAPESAARFREAVATNGVRATAVHHGYLLNLATPKAPALARARGMFLDEIHRAELLGVDALIFHPGAHLGSGVEAGLRSVAESLQRTLEAVPQLRVRLLLENAAGQGTTIGASFEELAWILSRVGAPDHLGVTLDTCHLFAAGHDFRTDAGYGAMIDRIGATFGTDAVRAFHLNDAKADLGSHLDRHENIGRGQIGADGFRPLLNDRRWTDVPGYLETPLDDHGYARYAEDLTTLRSLVEGAPARPPPASRARRARGAARTVK